MANVENPDRGQAVGVSESIAAGRRDSSEFNTSPLDHQIRRLMRDHPTRDPGEASCQPLKRGGGSFRSASFPICLNAGWRVVDAGDQWVLQRLNPKAKDRRHEWEARRFHADRDALLRISVRELCGPVDPSAMEALERLPEVYPWRGGDHG